MRVPTPPAEIADQPGRASRLGLAAFTLLVLWLTHFFHLGTLPFIGADEPRYARIGEEMWRSGDFVTPTLNGAAWLEKPPLLYWLEAVSYSLFGLSEWTARLPSALLSLACIGMAAWLLARCGRPRPARLVLLILPTAPLYAAFARTASTDMPLVACLCVGLMCAYLASREQRIGWAAAAGVAVGLAVLAKGPVAVVLAGGILGSYTLVCRRLLWNWRQLAVGAGLFTIVAAPWFWLVWKANGYDFLVTFVINHHIARYLTAVHRHSQPFWFYGGVIVLGFFPWGLFLISALRRLRHQVGSWQWGQRPLEPLLWLWVAVPLVFFSLSESKLAGYIMPVFPALAILAALEWDRYLEGDVTASRTIRLELAAISVLGGALAIGLIIGSRLTYELVWPGLMLAAPIAAGCFGIWRPWRHRRPLGILLGLTAAMTLFVASAYAFAAPVAGPFHSLRALATRVRPHLSPSEPLILYRCFHHTAFYYADYMVTPDAIGSMVQLSSYFAAFPQQRYFLLVKDDGLKDLVNQLGELGEVTGAGPFYLVEYLPPAER